VITIGALGATIEVTGNNPTAQITQSIGGSVGTLDIRGNGNLQLSAASPRSASNRIFDCVVRMINAAALGSGSITLGSDPLIGEIGTIEIPDGVNLVNSVTMNNSGAMRGAGTLGVFGGTCTVTGTGRFIGGLTATDTLRLGNVGSALSGDPGTLSIVEGPGTVLTNVPNNYQGDWRIDSGTLRVGHGTGLGTATTPVVVNSGGTLSLPSVTFQRAITLNSGSTLALEPPSQAYGPVSIASGAQVTLDTRTTGTASIGNGPNTLTGGGGGAGITVTGNNPNATLSLFFPSDYVGSWSVNGGEVLISDDANLGPVSNAFSLNTNGALRTNGSVTLSRVITPNGGTLRAEGASTDLTLASGLEGVPGSLFTAGTGRVILQSPSLRTGDTRINGAVLRVENPTALGVNGFGQAYVGGTAVPGISPTLELGGVAITEDIRLESDGATLRGTGIAANNGSITVAAGVDARLESGASVNDVVTLGGVDNNLFGGTGGSTITVAGAGRVVQTHSSTYQGTWLLSSGTLEIDADSRLGAAVSTVNLLGGTLSTSASFSTSRTFSGNGGTILTQPFTTLTLNSPLNSTGGSLTKAGAGGLVLTSPSTRTGPTTIDAGTVEVNGTTSGLGSGNVTINGGMLQLTNANYTSGAGGIILNSGALLRGIGNCAYSNSGFPAVQNGAAGSPVSVGLNVPGATDVLTIQSAIRNVVDANPSFATIVKQGNGKLILRTGGTSATDIYGGSWNVTGGILQIGPFLGGEILNALGFKNGDPKQANTITVSSGTLAVGSVNSTGGSPDFLRANVILSGGAIASTNGFDAKYGGDFKATVSSTNKVLLFDPSNPLQSRNVSLVAGAEGANNLAAETVWGPGSPLIVDPGTTSGGAFNITRDGGTVSVVGTPILQINQGATVNLGGTLDALSDGVDHVNVVNNSATSFNVTGGSHTVGTLSGTGNSTVDFGGTLSAARISQNALTINGTLNLRVDPAVPGPCTLNALTIVSGEIGVTLAGSLPGTEYSQVAITGGLTLGETLTINLANGFDPPVGQTFVIMTFASRGGAFDTINGLEIGPGKEFRLDYNANDISLIVVVPTPPPGDMDCDGNSSTLDVEPFVLALTDPVQYAQQFPTCNPLNGDMNQDAILDGADIAQFINCLIHGGCQ
jgi:fibronectin-binding autotransporter adhesin